jgi:hypothetical protein
MYQWKRVVAAGVVCAGLSGGSIGLFTSAASASPTKAPSALSGKFDCGSVGSGMFVINSGNSQATTTWNVAHLTFANGSTAVFQPRALNLTITFNGQTVTQNASKNGPGSTVCSISAGGPGFSLSGTVTGKITPTGH